MEPIAEPQQPEVKPSQQEDAGAKIMASLPDQSLPQSQAQPQTPDIGAQIMAKLPDQQTLAEKAYDSVSHLDPEKAAKVIPIAAQTGHDPAYVDKNLDGLQAAQKAPTGSMWKEMADQYPAMSKYFEDPANVAMTHDDIPALMDHAKAAKDYGLDNQILNQERMAWNGFLSSISNVAPTLVDVAGAIQHVPTGLMNVATGGDYGEPTIQAPAIMRNNAMQEKLTAANESIKAFTPMINEDLTSLITDGNIGEASKKVAGMIASSIPTISAFLATEGASSVPAAAGLMGTFATSEKYQANRKGGQGQTGAAANAVATGAINTALFSVGGGGMLSNFEKALAPSVGKETARQIAMGASRHLAISTVEAAVPMLAAAQAQKLDDWATGTNPDALKEPGMGLVRDAVESLAQGFAFGLPTAGIHGMSRLIDAHTQQVQANNAKAFYLKNEELAQAAKLQQRNPEAHGELMKEAIIPDQKAVFPTEALESFYQKSGLDPGEEMEKLGFGDHYKEGQTTGHVEIPLADWTEKTAGKPEYKGLADDFKPSVDAFTNNEIKAHGKEIEAKLTGVDQEAQKGKAKEQGPDEKLMAQMKAVKTDLDAKTAAAGEGKNKSANWLDAMFFGKLAKRTGQDAFELYKRANYVITGRGGKNIDGLRENNRRAQAEDQAWKNSPNKLLEGQSVDIGARPTDPSRAKSWDRQKKSFQELGYKVNGEGAKKPGELADTLYHSMDSLHPDKTLSDLKSEAEKDDPNAPKPDMEADALLEYLQRFPGKTRADYIKNARQDPHMMGEFGQDKMPDESFNQTGKVPEELKPIYEDLNKSITVPGGVEKFLKWMDPRLSEKSDENKTLMNMVRKKLANPEDFKQVWQNMLNDADKSPRTVKVVDNEGVEYTLEVGHTGGVLDEKSNSNSPEQTQRLVDSSDGTKNSTGNEGQSGRDKGNEPPGFFNRLKQTFFQRDNPSSKLKQAEKSDELGRTDINKTPQGPEISHTYGPKAKFSTFIHEKAHGFMAIMEHMFNEKLLDEEGSADWKKFREFTGAKEGEELKPEHHEKGVEAIVQEVRQGNLAAKEPWLKRILQKFSNFLKGEWQTDAEKNTAANPKWVSDVINRMFASDDAITKAQHDTGFRDDDLEGLPADKARELGKMHASARRQAEDELMKPMMKETTPEHQAMLEQERKRITDEVTKSVDDMPVFRASREIEGNVGGESGPVDIAKRVLEGKASPEELTAFEVSSGSNAFASGADLAKQIVDADTSGLRESEIAKRVEQGMVKYQDVMKDPGQMRDMAMKAIHSDKTVEVLALEKQIYEGMKSGGGKEFSKVERAKALLDAKLAKEKAFDLLSQKSIDEAGKPSTYYTAEKNMAVKSALARKAGDFTKAADYKEKQMLNHALARRAEKNEPLIDKAEKYLDKIAGRGQDLLDMPYGHVRQADKLLEQNGFKDKTEEQEMVLQTNAEKMEGEKKTRDEIADATGFVRDDSGNWKQENLTDFLDRIDDNLWHLKESIGPSMLDGKTRTKGTMAMSDLMDLKQAVQAIVHVGRKQDKMFDESVRGGIRKESADLRTSIEAKIGAPYAEDKKYGVKDANFAKKGAEALLNLPTKAAPLLTNILTLAKYLDQGTDGPVHKLLYRVIKHGEDAEIALHEKTTKAFQDLHDKYFSWTETEMDRGLHGLAPVIRFPEVPGRTFTKTDVRNMAANMGNDTNFQRLVDSFHLTREQLRAMVDRHMEKKDWDFLQDRGNLLKKMWPDIVKQKMEVNGIEPKAVEVTPVQTKWGTLDGWYHPIDYDPNKAASSFKNDIQRAQEWKSTSPTAGYTQSGFTKSRVKKVLDRPMRLGDDVISNHLQDVIHNQAYQKPVIDALRVLKNSDTKQALENSLGIAGAKTFNDWVQYLGAPEAKQINGFEKAARYLRVGFIFSKVAFRPVMIPRKYAADTVNVLSELGGGNSALGAVKWGTAVKDYYSDRKAINEFNNQDPNMRKRNSGNINFDINDVTKNLSPVNKRVRMMAFVAERLADQNVSNPLYHHIYQANVAEKGESVARDMAWESVVRTLGSGSKLEQVGVQRGNEFMKMLAPAYSFQSAVYNRFWGKYKDAGIEFKAGNRGGAMLTVAGAMLQVGLIGGIDGLTTAFFRNAMEPDDEKDKKRLAAGVIASPFKTIPGIGTAAEWGVDKMMGLNTGDLHLTPVDTAAEILMKPFLDQDSVLFGPKEENESMAEDLSKAFEMTGVEPAILNTWVFNFVDYLNENGEATWKDLTTRRTKH